MIKCVRDLKKSLITLSHHVPNDLQRPNSPFGHFWSKVCQFICWYLPISFGDSLFLCCCIYQNAFSVFWVDMEIARTALYQMKQMNGKKKQKPFLTLHYMGGGWIPPPLPTLKPRSSTRSLPVCPITISTWSHGYP